MEESKPSVSYSGSLQLDDCGMESRLVDFCKDVDERTRNDALKLFRESKHLLLSNNSALGTGSPEETEKLWFAIILYAVKRLNAETSIRRVNKEIAEAGFSLYQLLKNAKLNVVDFFKEMSQFCLKAGSVLSNLYGPDWEKRLQAKELQTNFVHLTILSKYYKRAFMELFLPSRNEEKQVGLSNGKGTIPDYLRFGWLLFLALRVHAFSQFKDLVTCTNGLVSILGILILHIPAKFRRFSLVDSPKFVKKSEKGVDLVESLCNTYHTSEDDLKKMMEAANGLIVGILKKKGGAASDYKADCLRDIDTDGLTYFEDLMEEDFLSSSICNLEDDYEFAIQDKNELDERIFVDEEDSFVGTSSLSGGGVTIRGTKHKHDPFSSPTKTVTSPSSPISSTHPSIMNGDSAHNGSNMVPTPVSTAMTTAKWLRTVIAPLSAIPSEELQQFLSSCDRDLTDDVTRRANIILEAIFPSAPPADRCVPGSLQTATRMDSIWSEQRRMEALKLYYRVLVAMCRAESQTLQSKNLTSLLANERFHRCMLACSAELVLATHKTVTMMFPAVLERTGITAFDLSKVIESFVRHEETLPRELKRHLNSSEERLLESMAWEGSSMYNSLIVARPALAAEINSLGLLAEPMPSLDSIAQYNINGSLHGYPTLLRHEYLNGQNAVMRSPKRLRFEVGGVLAERNSFASPAKERLMNSSCSKLTLQSPLLSAFASPTKPNPTGAGETCAETGINVFLRKVLKLAAIRIKSLCERLQQSNAIMESVYCLIQQILNKQTSLFFNRHIDQIILCSLYGVSKISQLSLTFKEIIFHYRKQPQCKPQVFRNVFVDWPSTRVNGKPAPEHVDIITFYNEVFIPAVKPLLVELGPTGATTKAIRVKEEKNKADGQLPGSPRVSFSSLPDMSPKKISASHNVYVSPLRSSKREALISPNSRSYYACVGESTHAYQSPSKDLTAINSRLNRKVCSRLNFDEAGVVSDSLVAGSLYPPNGNSVPSMDASNLCSPLKRRSVDRYHSTHSVRISSG